ncbi:MAG: Ig-like domain-containing protein [Minisyncoccales bacterium]
MKHFILLTAVAIMVIIATFGAGCTSADSPKKSVKITQVSVDPNILYLEISPNEVDKAKVGYEVQFTAKAYNASRNEIPETKITWKITEGAGRATIDSNGLLYPKSTGKVNVTATIGGKSITAMVTIKSAPVVKHKKCEWDDDYEHHHCKSVTIKKISNVA